MEEAVIVLRNGEIDYISTCVKYVEYDNKIIVNNGAYDYGYLKDDINSFEVREYSEEA